MQLCAGNACQIQTWLSGDSECGKSCRILRAFKQGACLCIAGYWYLCNTEGNASIGYFLPS